MNVLLTSAGRRNYLVACFQAALGDAGLVFAADSNAAAPALAEVDRAFVLPPFVDERYVDSLLGICREHQVRLLVALNDFELPVLAQHLHRFRAVGTIPVISSSDVVNICLDKWATIGFLQHCGLPVPPSFLSLDEARNALKRGTLTFPVVLKPRWGTASIGIEYPQDEEELPLAYALLQRRLNRNLLKDVRAAQGEPSIVIQQCLDGCEYGLDIVNDLDGRHVATLARRKLAMRAGETDRAVTITDATLGEVGSVIGRTLRHVGNLDCDAFITGGKCYIVDMNPRFGGGYPFSHAAGANLPAALIAWADGAPHEPRWVRVDPDVTASKCDRIVVKAADCDSAIDPIEYPRRTLVRLGGYAS